MIMKQETKKIFKNNRFPWPISRVLKFGDMDILHDKYTGGKYIFLKYSIQSIH